MTGYNILYPQTLHKYQLGSDESFNLTRIRCQKVVNFKTTST